MEITKNVPICKVHLHISCIWLLICQFIINVESQIKSHKIANNVGCGTASNSSIPTGWLFVDFFSHIHFSIITEDRMLLARMIFFTRALLKYILTFCLLFCCCCCFCNVTYSHLWSEKNALPVHTKSTFCFIFKSCTKLPGNTRTTTKYTHLGDYPRNFLQ